MRYCECMAYIVEARAIVGDVEPAPLFEAQKASAVRYVSQSERSIPCTVCGVYEIVTDCSFVQGEMSAPAASAAAMRQW